ncbi:kinase-like domain-containing protein [Hypoxylon fragiforme]|uniref:kinase-like domain-containing protein n=1 Tax=Hypoxylon fragiforme TaxID=63214 RepID=UPI0020C5FDB0|nr:kinase-like domain-containing protein [Hypoxylon fragiforme]KAI2610179.1 kinase-like domain-containing protein [Hypoxylon fragiforme]
MEFGSPFDNLAKAVEYDFLTEISPGVWKISRRHDKVEFIAHDFTDKFTDNPHIPLEKGGSDFYHLLHSGNAPLEEALSSVLSHENLVSLVDWLPVQKTGGGGRPQLRYYIVWDFCNAGNLGNLLVEKPLAPIVNKHPPDYDEEPFSPNRVLDQGLTEPPEPPRVMFLPESLCWHVLVSVLKALAWLHDGSRQINSHGNGNYGMTPSRDWQPILHRDIHPNNIFFCHPRRREWYGYCKLGNYGSVSISNHHHGNGKEHAASRARSKPLAPPPEKGFQPLRELVQLDAKWSYTYPEQREQPYTVISEWRAFGEIMQAMMIPPAQKNHLAYVGMTRVEENLRYSAYSSGLKNMVIKLMTLNPDERMEDGSYRFSMRTCITSRLCVDAFTAFQHWRRTGDLEAQSMIISEQELAQQLAEDNAEEERLTDSRREIEDILTAQDEHFRDIPRERELIAARGAESPVNYEEGDPEDMDDGFLH